MATTTLAGVDLERRLTDALGAHDVHPEDRIRIQEAYVDAGMLDASWDDLPADIRTLVEDIEQNYPRQSWDDPTQVPDELPGELSDDELTE